jgi:hypothetical protein
VALIRRGGKWCIRYYGPDGWQRWETIGPNKKEAETVLAQRTYEVRSGKYPILRRRSRMRFSEFAEEWLQNYAKAHVRASTLSTYRWLGGSHLIPAFGSRFLATLTHKDLSDYIAEKIQAGRIAPRTVNHSLVLLKQMLEAAVDWGYLPHNPARRVRKLKDRSHRSADLDDWGDPPIPAERLGRVAAAVPGGPVCGPPTGGDPGARLGSAEPPDVCHPQDRGSVGVQ